MALAHFQRTVQDTSGNISPSAAFEVRNEATGNLATLYSDRAGGVGISNPNTASVAGLIDFYVVGGAYRITVTGGADWRYVPIGTAAEYDIADLIAAQDAMVLKGVIDCSGNPSYPAADRGHVYIVSVAGKIGGGSGTDVDIGDELTCKTDGTASGTQAGVGAQWNIVEHNLNAASNSVAGKVKVSTNSSMLTGTATDEAARVVDVATNFVAQGLHLIGCWPARALKPAVTNGAVSLNTAESTTNKVCDEYVGFVNAATTYAGFSFRAPQSMDEGTFIAEIEWMEASGAAAHVCRWQVEMQAQGDADTIDAAWGTAVAVDDTGSSGTRRFISTAAITPGGTWAAGDKIHVRVARLGGHANDTLDVDARLIGVTLFGTINAKNDA